MMPKPHSCETAVPTSRPARLRTTGRPPAARTVSINLRNMRSKVAKEKEPAPLLRGERVRFRPRDTDDGSADQRRDRLALGDGQRPAEVVAHLRRRVDA